jgi:hypothetical protein
MRRAILFIIVLGAIAATGAATARSASPVAVSLGACYFGNGGEATVPAGSDVAVRFGWTEKTKGRVENFLNAQSTTADVNGSPIAKASDLWGRIRDNATTWNSYAGTLDHAGDSLTVRFQIRLSHAVSEGKGSKVGPGLILPADFACRITAV